MKRKNQVAGVNISVDGKTIELDENALGRAITCLVGTADHEKISLPHFIGIIEGIKSDVICKKLKQPKKNEFVKYHRVSNDNKLRIDNPELLDFMIRALVWEGSKKMHNGQLVGVLEILKSDTIASNQEMAKREQAEQAAAESNGSMYG